MPHCYSFFQFVTNFPDDVSSQAKQLVITWPSLLQQNLALVGSVLRMDPIGPSTSSHNKIIFDVFVIYYGDC